MVSACFLSTFVKIPSAAAEVKSEIRYMVNHQRHVYSFLSTIVDIALLWLYKGL